MFTQEQKQRLAEGAAEWGLELDEQKLHRFSRFAERLEEANREFNLTRVPPEEVETLHLLDSLALASVWKPEPSNRLLDVGTGAGFPGLPLAIVFPELDVTLLDGTGKRLRFLDSVIAELGLTNARTLHERAEELARLAEHRAQYDIVTARAVAKLPVLAGWLLPLARPGGLAVAYKSADIEEELEAARAVLRKEKGSVEKVVTLTLPFTEIERKLVLMRKSGGDLTPGPFPDSSATRTGKG